MTRRSAPPGSDAGFGQVDCLFIAVSAPVGALVGFIIVLAATDFGATLGAPVIGVFAGWLSGGFALWFGLKLALRISFLRDNAENVGFGFALVAPGTIALIVALVIGVAEAYNGLDRFFQGFPPR